MGIEELRQLLEQKKVEARGLLETDLAKAEKTMEEVRELQKKIALYEEIEEQENGCTSSLGNIWKSSVCCGC